MRTIQVLEPINSKILHFPTQEERTAFKLKPNLGGVFKSVHQRVIKKIYGREAGLEVVAAMQEIPGIAIPIVFERLRQKEEEWKRSQREWNKIWREVDKRNYYKSLDHQGATFKVSDKKMIAGRFFVTQIEAARDQERSRRASLVDPTFVRTRPKHHLEFSLDNLSVLRDALKLCLSYLDRTQASYNAMDRRKIEEFLRSFPPMLLGLDQAQFDSVFTVAADGLDSDGLMSDDVSIADEEEISMRTQRTRRSANGLGSSAKDLRKRLLKSEQAKSTRALRGDGTASPRSRSRHQSPQVSEPGGGESPYSTRQSNGRSARARQSIKDPIFFSNQFIYIFIRQLLVCASLTHNHKLTYSSTVTDFPFG